MVCVHVVEGSAHGLEHGQAARADEADRRRRTLVQPLSGLDHRGRPAAHLVKHMVEHGHERIAMISGVPGVRTTEERIEGYLAGLRSAGGTEDPDLIVSGRSHADGAERAVHALLERPSPPPPW